MLHALITALAAIPVAAPGEVHMNRDPDTGMVIYSASVGSTAIRVVPAAGCNVYSIKHKDREILRVPNAIKDLPGFMYGTPVLYPTPNRVRDSVMTFQGKKYQFTPNNDANFLHGLVHNVAWKHDGQETSAKHVSLQFSLDFAEGTAWYKLFPHEHTLRLTINVTDGAVRWVYTVDNEKGKTAVPFGFALHPWFLYQGRRADTYLTVPATHWMEAEKLLPTGKLVDLEGLKYDCRKPRSLEGFVIDDVFYGLKPEHPTLIDYRDKGFKIALHATVDFTHLVVYTPDAQPWFCVENQTCSTDAHNLYERGLKRESNLFLVEPGKRHSGHVEFRFEGK